MPPEEHIEIPISEKKTSLLLLGSAVFVLVGVRLLVGEPVVRGPFTAFLGLMPQELLGVISILFFGLAGITVLIKLLSSPAGLVINSKGIIDRSSGVSVGEIPWNDIQELKITEVIINRSLPLSLGQKFIMVIVRNPMDYINKEKNPIKKYAMMSNFRDYGSPISISSNALKIDLYDLQKLLLEKASEYKYEVPLR